MRRWWPRTTSGTSRTASTSPTRPVARSSGQAAAATRTIDEGLRGGETIRLADDWRVDVLHLPGHTLGHVGIWDERSRAAIVIDAVLERGIYANDGALLIPPRIYDLAAYRHTIRRLRALEPELLLTAHYPVMDAAAARDFLDRSLAFTHELERAVREEIAAGTHALWPLTQAMDKRFGPYPEFMTELGALVRAAAAPLALRGSASTWTD